MLKLIAIHVLILHLVACFSYISIRFETNQWQTWVGERDLVDKPAGFIYMNAVYWAFQTSTTVGYGDFTIDT